MANPDRDQFGRLWFCARSGEPINQIFDDSENSRAWEPRDLTETPGARYVRQETEGLMRKAIQRLPCIFREAMELQHSRDYSTSQVADELGISLSAAKSRLMRARRTLERRLSGMRPRKASKGDSKSR